MGPVIPAAARMVDLWYRLPGTQEKLFNGAAIAMGGLHHEYDSSKAERELAYAHRPLDETLRDAWAMDQRASFMIAVGNWNAPALDRGAKRACLGDSKNFKKFATTQILHSIPFRHPSIFSVHGMLARA